ncbi:[acyl-carrier-protein] S-malonyltransferase [Alteromonas alba]|jgi:[acyl-carrier-protein] S-malonyltransferase|uniref:Malonyl CoA-acyl carrier protein transacylase n=1 Tax=Alteromonas alba TaxID=2079529 RepID=A0A2S9V6M9_9ALTE|nr:ACP S-malonyltransferase [Alteromonas alba]HCA75461.1 [acyl-carrier-protein] S-malonyltransferase [Alteromonas sp.]PRO72117.1 [acyl-carrier-protein] S-malonyltransferase [Alteromonas alba]HCB09494.1 [acyl-carrier-protein] S-malonyltransferase [Alteromonas sp.]HCL12678.1 [acyl-carrier-protein] S-malonyltransferase [Alteromonas sp.]HCV19649.1 [acyl-carrier-protein] S-malonyltransferase [Alteromonas sp.]|tara:strand:- start:2771 stop:3706 length:936 start_codon:yes stop_codon:yes gene_type:complete
MTRIACVFPGQGSQAVGMLKELADVHPSILDTFAQASEALGYDLWDVVQNDPDSKLNETQVTQPALLTASVAIYRLLAEQGIAPEYMAGHSLGEYSALVCAGVLDFAEAVKLVEARGEFMQQAVPAGAGAMYAIIGLDDDSIAEICHDTAVATGDVVSPVNYNSPGQVVIAGEKNAAEQAANACKEAGAKRALPLAVSVPSHCELMRPAADHLDDKLETIAIAEPTVKVVNNVDVAVESDPAGIRSALVRQLYCPVQWTKTVEFLAAEGIDTIIEVGPGKVLTGLGKRIVKSVSYIAVNTPETVASWQAEE